jgi:hypothetical protein
LKHAIRSLDENDARLGRIDPSEVAR